MDKGSIIQWCASKNNIKMDNKHLKMLIYYSVDSYKWKHRQYHMHLVAVIKSRWQVLAQVWRDVQPSWKTMSQFLRMRPSHHMTQQLYFENVPERIENTCPHRNIYMKTPRSTIQSSRKLLISVWSLGDHSMSIRNKEYCFNNNKKKVLKSKQTTAKTQQ